MYIIIFVIKSENKVFLILKKMYILLVYIYLKIVGKVYIMIKLVNIWKYLKFIMCIIWMINLVSLLYVGIDILSIEKKRRNKWKW